MEAILFDECDPLYRRNLFVVQTQTVLTESAPAKKLVVRLCGVLNSPQLWAAMFCLPRGTVAR